MRLLVLLVAAGVAAAQQPDFPINLRQGVMAGEVGETSAILQSRLTSSNPYQDPRWEGIRGEDGWAYFEIADNPGFDNARRTAWLEAVPKTDFLVKTVVGNLRPGTKHYYRLHYGPDQQTLRVSEPAKTAGTALLIIDKESEQPEFYLRLPELEKARRIRSRRLRGPDAGGPRSVVVAINRPSSL